LNRTASEKEANRMWPALRTLVCLAAIFGLAQQTAFAQPPARRPNFIFILADDLGWGDLGCYGNRVIKTPNLDRMAREGTLFTQFYANGSVCSPSRCAFFTGQYPSRHRIHGHYSTRQQNEARGMSNWLETSVPNAASVLKSAGYTTAHIGKWHLGNDANGPAATDYGFDVVGTSERGGANGPSTDPYFRAKSSEQFVDEAIAFIERAADQPFYLQLWTLVPHATLNPMPQQMQPYARLRAGEQDFPHVSAIEIYAASVSDLDAQIGRLLSALQRLGKDRDTLVFFSSDNGPEDIHIANAGHSGIGSAGPFRGRKRSLYEGGVRVPGIVRWPGRVPANRIDDQSVLAGVDWLPSVCALAGVSIPSEHALDGEDMSLAWTSGSRPRTKPLFWEWRFNIAGEPFHHSPELAIRDGNWKLLMNPDRSRVELYEITQDLTQLNNVAQNHPNVVERLAGHVTSWAKTLPEGPRDASAGKMHYGSPTAPELRR
jgi:N-acetylgalactosamine-6-sulfatase